jgi:hypothetical protein
MVVGSAVGGVHACSGMVRIQNAAGGEGGIDLSGLGKIQKEWNRLEQVDMHPKEYNLR